jgi:hypothetical protein
MFEVLAHFLHAVTYPAANNFEVPYEKGHAFRGRRTTGFHGCSKNRVRNLASDSNATAIRTKNENFLRDHHQERR